MLIIGQAQYIVAEMRYYRLLSAKKHFMFRVQVMAQILENGDEKMASITDIKVKILELAAAPFQEFCDTLLSKMGYGTIHGLGMKAGTGNTTIGNPDTYFRSDSGKS